MQAGSLFAPVEITPPSQGIAMDFIDLVLVLVLVLGVAAALTRLRSHAAPLAKREDPPMWDPEGGRGRAWQQVPHTPHGGKLKAPNHTHANAGAGQAAHLRWRGPDETRPKPAQIFSPTPAGPFGHSATTPHAHGHTPTQSPPPVVQGWNPRPEARGGGAKQADGALWASPPLGPTAPAQGGGAPMVQAQQGVAPNVSSPLQPAHMSPPPRQGPPLGPADVGSSSQQPPSVPMQPPRQGQSDAPDAPPAQPAHAQERAPRPAVQQAPGVHLPRPGRQGSTPLHVAAAQAAASASLASQAPEARLPSGDTEIEYSALKLGALVGQGAFGRVYEGRWRGSPVAVKLLAVPSLTQELVEEFRGEAKVMAALRHPNVVLFMGVCSTAPHYAIVTEYISRGSLWGVLHAADSAGAVPTASSSGGSTGSDWDPRLPGKVPWKLLLRMALDAARGMAFLHSASPPLLHRDLKSGNLLVGDAWNVKLTDFGLTRVRAYAATMTGSVGTCQWMANEVLAQARYTEKADVYSFGIVLWELVTRECPYNHIPSSVQVAVAVLKDGIRPLVPPSTPSALASLMQACWDPVPEARPSMEQVLEALEAMQ